MSRVASNHTTTTRFNNGIGPTASSLLNRSTSNASSIHSINNGSGGRGVTVRSAAPPPAQKETVHACPLCNTGYKDPRVLPCTHTYCLNCIREKLIKNSRVTCPKCHHQVHPFDEAQLLDLPRNLILSQEWRASARPLLPTSTHKKPVTYQSIVSTPTATQQPIPSSNSLSVTSSNMQHHEQQQQDRRKSSVADSGTHETTTNGNSVGVAALVNAYNQPSGGAVRSSRASSTASSLASQPVSNLAKIYSEATGQRSQYPQQAQKQRGDSVASTGKHDELTRIFEQASNQIQRQRTPSSSLVKQPAHAHEEAYEEITWDNLLHGQPPVAPPFPDQWQSATENRHQPPREPERPISAASSVSQHHSPRDDDHTNVNNLRDMVASIHQHFNEQSSFHPAPPPQGPVLDSQISSRDSIATSSQGDLDDDNDDLDGGDRTPVRQSSYTVNRQPGRQVSHVDSVHSASTNATPVRSPVPPVSAFQPRSSVATTQHAQQDDRLSFRTPPSATSSGRQSVDRFPPPPQNIETLDFGSDRDTKRRPTSSISTRSSAYGDAREQPSINETRLMPTERFNPDVDMPPPIHTSNSSRAQSQVGSGSSTPTARPSSTSVERDTRQYRQQQQPQDRYLAPTTSTAGAGSVSSRVNTLLSDQKRLEREIEEAIKRLTVDYEDIQAQIDRKESAIHAEVKNIAARLDEDITEHYHRKQKTYASLAADTSTVGSELERLRSTTHSNNNNKQQLWTNLEQLESNIRKIRHAVEQEKEPRGSLTFAEGRRAIAADTIGQITFNGMEHRHSSPQPPLSVRQQPTPQEQSVTALTPYKYLKIDHLASLEPEAIAMTQHNKKILLGICNKLFILNEYGDTLKTIPLSPSIRGIAVSKKSQSLNIAYVSHDETVSMIDIDSGQSLDCVKETDAHGESGTFLPLGIDTDNTRGDVYVCDYRNSCVIKFDDKLEFLTQWRIYNHSTQYDEARPKLISVYGQRLYMIVEHSCKPYYNQGIAYTFSLHICDSNSGNIVKIIDAELLSTQRLRWPCSVQAINDERCYILDTMTSGKYFNGQWQKHWSRVLEIAQGDAGVVTELFQLDSEAATMAMTKQTMVIAANGEILYVDLGFLQQQQPQRHSIADDHNYQNLS